MNITAIDVATEAHEDALRNGEGAFAAACAAGHARNIAQPGVQVLDEAGHGAEPAAEPRGEPALGHPGGHQLPEVPPGAPPVPGARRGGRGRALRLGGLVLPLARAQVPLVPAAARLLRPAAARDEPEAHARVGGREHRGAAGLRLRHLLALGREGAGVPRGGDAAGHGRAPDGVPLHLRALRLRGRLRERGRRVRDDADGARLR